MVLLTRRSLWGEIRRHSKGETYSALFFNNVKSNYGFANSSRMVYEGVRGLRSNYGVHGNQEAAANAMSTSHKQQGGRYVYRLSVKGVLFVRGRARAIAGVFMFVFVVHFRAGSFVRD